MDPLNQFGVVFFRAVLKDLQNLKEINETITLRVNKISTDPFKRLQEIDTSELNVTLHKEESLELFSENGTLIGYQYPLWVFRKLERASYAIILDLKTPIDQIENVEDYELSFLVVNQEFTKYTIVIRYFFMVWSILGAVLYWMRYRRIPSNYRVFEQKMVGVLAILLIFFNDPIYPATVLTGNKAASYFSVFFMITFVIFLLFLWILFIDRIYFEDGQKKTELLNWKRVLYIILTYILTLAFYTEYAFDNLDDLPIVPAYDLVSKKFVVLMAFCLILTLLGFGYIMIRYAQVCAQVDLKLWRNQLYMFFSLFFMFVTLVMFFMNGFSVFSYHGNRILLLYTEMNMYTFYMEYMHSITKQEMVRIERGQLSDTNSGQANDEYKQDRGLLKSDGQEDCVDLEFDEMPSGVFRGEDIRFKQQFEEQKSRNYEEQRYQMKNRSIQTPAADVSSPSEVASHGTKSPVKEHRFQGKKDFGDFELE